MKKRQQILSILICGPHQQLITSLTVMQQYVYQMKFRNVCEVKKCLVEPGLVWSRTLSILLSMNGKSISLLDNACVRIMGQHFKQFYCKQLKNGQLDEMSAKVSEM